MCDSDYSALLTTNDVTIFNPDNTPVLNRKRNTSNGLWDVNMSSPKPTSSPATPKNPNANAVLPLDNRKYELTSYLHAALGCPNKSTFIQAISNGNFITGPGLTTNLIYKHLPTYLPTMIIHLTQEQQNIHSTKPIPKTVKLKS